MNRSAAINHGIAFGWPWFLLLVLPFVYFYCEITAVALLSFVAAISALLLLGNLQPERVKVQAGSIATAVAAITFFLLAFRATWWSVDFSSSWPALVKIGAFLLLFFSLSWVSPLPIFRQQMLRAATWSGIIHGLLALQEFIEAPPIPATWIDPALQQFIRTRCSGIFTDPNIFGAFLALLFIFISLALIRAETTKARAGAATALLLTGFAELTTLSRGSWIALAAGLLLFSFCYLRQREKHDLRLFLAIIAVLGAIALLGPFRYRIFSIVKTQDMTIAQRSLILKGFKDNFAKLPLIGHGPHTFNQVYPRYRAVGGDYPLNAHNEFLHSLVETGHLSSLLLFLLFILILIPATRARKDLVANSGAAAFLCLFIHNQVGFSSRILPTAVLMIFAAALARNNNRAIITLNSSIRKFFSAFVFLSALAIMYFAWQSAEIQSKMQQGVEAMAQGNLTEALNIFTAVESVEPTNSLASARKAEIFMAMNNKSAAKASLVRALSANQGEALYWIKLARLSDANQAEEYYQKAIELDPAAELFRLEFARFLVGQGKKQQALEQLEAALKTSPGFHQVYRNYLEIESFKARLTGK